MLLGRVRPGLLTPSSSSYLDVPVSDQSYLDVPVSKRTSTATVHGLQAVTCREKQLEDPAFRQRVTTALGSLHEVL